MNVKQIVKGYLRAHGLNGLSCSECCCSLEDDELMICDSPQELCEAGISFICTDPECEWGPDEHCHVKPKETP